MLHRFFGIIFCIKSFIRILHYISEHISWRVSAGKDTMIWCYIELILWKDVDDDDDDEEEEEEVFMACIHLVCFDG